MSKSFVVLGAGVVGISTAVVLKDQHPDAAVIVAAQYFPGDRHHTYTSPVAGANWLSVALDNGFLELALKGHETWVERIEIRAIYDREPEDAGVLSETTNKIWYEKLVGGLRMLPRDALPSGAKFGYEADSFVVNTQIYLPWLQGEARKRGIEMHRRTYIDIKELFDDYPEATAYFNCTGIGAAKLGGVQDAAVYPTKGQVLLVESPKVPLQRMYFRSPRRVDNDTTYIFPRGTTGGVVLGGCRWDHAWDGDIDPTLAEDIKRRCCALAPELGRPEDLKVISHSVGLRPSRKGGARIEREQFGRALVIHNYGAGGAGYQASWGMAQEAAKLLLSDSRL
ncbi:putative D-amino acid oxidase [Thozetella sp. PMI_491]|nr:putative D-amino acid oxidase [Thozetella sp. PMI_491]